MMPRACKIVPKMTISTIAHATNKTASTPNAKLKAGRADHR